MEDAATLIRAIAALAWPIVVACFLYVYKPEIVGLIRRVRRGKAPGFEFEFAEALDALAESASAAEEAVPAVVPVDVRESGTNVMRVDVTGGATSSVSLGSSEADDRVQMILSEAAVSPKAALIALGAEIESEARRILASSQDPSNWRGRSLSHTLRRVGLPPTLRKAVDEFRHVRDRIIHGPGADDDDVLRALDSGVKILRALEAVPRQIHVVKSPRVDVFEDQNGERRREDVHGVLLETRTTDGEARLHVYPTTRTHFEEGKAVAWEWDTRKAWPESWYRDPESGQIKYAWGEAGEFIGPHLEDV